MRDETPKQITMAILEALLEKAPLVEGRINQAWRAIEVADSCAKTRVAIGSTVLSIWVERLALKAALTQVKKLPQKAWEVGRANGDWDFLY